MPMPFGVPWDSPWYSGSAALAASGVPSPFPIAIGGHKYIVEWNKYTRSSISPFRDARDSNALPGEQSLNPLAAWKRNRDDWSLGAGQTWADRALEPFNVRIELEPRQFRSSRGIDPWTIGQLTLHPDVDFWLLDGNTNHKMLVLGTYIYFMAGNALKRCANPDAGSPTITSITGITGTYNDITTDGQLVYISTSVGMFSHDPAGTTAAAMGGAAATYKPAKLLYTNGWLYGMLGNVISEIRAAGTVNMVFTHLNANFAFTVATGTPGATYFGGQSTDVNEIWRIGVKTDGTLAAALFSGSLPAGEFLRAMSYYGGILLLGTSKGFRIATLAGDGSLVVGPRVVDISEVRCVCGEGQFAWFGWSNYDASHTGVGRADLSNFSDTSNLYPAYASDIMAEGQAGAVLSVIRFNSKTYFAVSGAGFARQHATLKASQGVIQFGRFRWGTYEPKTFLGIEVISDPLTGATDGTVRMSTNLENGTNQSIGIRGPSDGKTGLGAIYGIAAITDPHDWYEPQVALDRGAGAAAPIIRRMTLRALPTPKTIEQFQIPIIMSADVNAGQGEGQDVPYNTNAEYQFLLGLVQAGVPVTFQQGDEQHLVTVREVAWADVFGMTPDRSGLEGHLLVTLITAEM